MHEDETSGRKLRNDAEARDPTEWFVSMEQPWLSLPECLSRIYKFRCSWKDLRDTYHLQEIPIHLLPIADLVTLS